MTDKQDQTTSIAAPRYIRAHWGPRSHPKVNKCDYVVATKYADGDPGDHFCVGIYNGSYDHFGQTRHLIVDNAGKSFRANGFRRVARVSTKRGEWIVKHLSLIERMKDRYSVWHWLRAPWSELREVADA